MDTINKPIGLEDITGWAPAGSCSRLQMLRLDQMHPVVSGNKWFKLRFQLEAARAANKTALLSFGGGFSNHLVALAFAAKENGLRSIGMVRGDYSAEKSPTLRSCEEFGMELHYLNKADYDRVSKAGNKELEAQYPDAWIVPEGGANFLGQKGAAEIARWIPSDTTDVCVSVGTGTTIAGLYMGLPYGTRVHGYCAASNCDAAEALIRSRFVASNVRLYSATDQRFGKWNDEQIEFMKAFFETTGIQLDVVYTGKMMMQLQSQLKNGLFPNDARIVCIHTGGLQGNPEGLFG
jgi:1-aminocyclopropane-1-carboxylate deaminase